MPYSETYVQVEDEAALINSHLNSLKLEPTKKKAMGYYNKNKLDK